MGWLPSAFFWASKSVHYWLGITSFLGITMSFFKVFGKKEEKEEKEVAKKLRPSLDTKLAIEFVQKNSNPEQRERLECILTGRKAKQDVLNSLVELQNPDGGFPYGLEKGRPSSIMDSLLALVRLEEYNCLDHESVDEVVRFLFSVQKSDGSWEEPSVIEEFNPPPWMKPGDLKAKVLTTAYTSFWLAKLNYVDREELIDAMDFLMRFVHPDGHFYGFLHTNWVAASFLAMMLGRDNWTVKGAISFLKEIPSDSWEPSQLGWLLWSLASAGFSANDPEVKHFLGILNKKQWEDGSFEPEAEGREVETTIEIIKALKLLGLIQEG
ncbi:MAG: hypothetical protein DRO05_02585 [Thermoproteota archaeon]|nr:MAG: hypothetical protein DRO05_02585 [Candidatus Korarchaeota archaeon]